MRSRRHALAGGLALAYSLALLGDQMLYVFLPSHPAAAGIAAASLGIVLSANRFVRLGANSLGGLLSDRLGRRRPYLLGMALALASTTGYLLSSSFWPLLLWRIVWGIAFALISVGGVAIMLDLSTSEDRGRTVGTYQSLLQLGTLLGLVLSGVLTDWLGYRGTLMIYVPLAALGLIVAVWVLRAPGAGEGSTARHERSAGLGTLAALRRLDATLLAPAYVNFASLFAGSGVLMATLGVYLKQLAAEPGTTLVVPIASLTGMLLATRRLAGMVGAPIAGHLLDRFGNRRIVAAAGVLVSLVGFTVLATGRGVGMVATGVVLVARTFRQTSKPLMPGSMISKTIRSGSNFSTSCKAALPSPTALTSYPSRRKLYVSESVIKGSSSTSKIRVKIHLRAYLLDIAIY